MQTQVFLKVSNPDLRGYVVWMPVTSYGKWEDAAHQQAWRIPDKRIRRYYDSTDHVGNTYAPLLHLTGSGPAWDVYLVFGPDARWNAQPPAPSFWMHQLVRRAPPEQALDPDKMTHAIQELLGVEKKAAQLVAPRHPLPWGEGVPLPSLFTRRSGTGEGSLVLAAKLVRP
jgi:hypothetical protein